MAKPGRVRAEKRLGADLATRMGTQFLKMIERPLIVLFPGEDGCGLVIRFVIGRFRGEDFLREPQSLRTSGGIGRSRLHIHAAQIEVCPSQPRVVADRRGERPARFAWMPLLDLDDAEQVVEAAVSGIGLECLGNLRPCSVQAS